MDRSITVSTRTLLIALVVAVGLVAAYLLGSSGGGSPAAASSEGGADADRPRELTMTGRGEASAVPDQLSFALAVSLQRADLGDALDAASASMSRVLSALADEGVAKGDVQTTGLSMDPVYDYDDYDPPTVVGYRVSQRASVLVDDLSRGGAAVSAAVAAGGNDVRVSDLRLLVGETDEVMADAREAAVEEARAKAEQYAAASGQSLGDVMTIREVSARPLPTPVVETSARAAAYDQMLRKVPIRAGRDEASVTVRIVWQLS
ncbi:MULTISPECIES: SIMPL domain-containing protein [unclassified Nocardioides]|uniref:SIMPL domain-containing protein n=1 Tax=unclassified Nocardioides TaxID=2615069 RepID=UPI00360A2509